MVGKLGDNRFAVEDEVGIRLKNLEALGTLLLYVVD